MSDEWKIVQRLKRENQNNSFGRKRYIETGEIIEYKPRKLTEKELISIFNKGQADNEMVEALLTKKSIRTRLNRLKPSNTVVTLPDDYISPFEDRMFSVREMARLQSFDDSFVFLGKRTTGGKRRRVEVPQYSQVGNAVPPLLAKAIAEEIVKVL